MKRIYLLLAASLMLATNTFAQVVAVELDTKSPQTVYAGTKLRLALAERGYEVEKIQKHVDLNVRLSTNAQKLGKEAFAISRRGKRVSIVGGDVRGLIYGALRVVEHLRNGGRLETLPAITEQPRLEFRGIKFNTPWDTYRPSSALDQHYATARDLKFWEAFLDMMVENRFNAISLWTLHPFTYLIQPKNFPEASPWSQAEFEEWQRLYRGIFRLAKERGLDTYLVHWSIFVSESFAKAHGVAQHNFYPHYYGDGDTSDIVKRYLRESVTQVLEEYPDLDGFGISHGEGMGGMTPLQRQEWMDDVLLAGMLAAKRPVKLIHRVPFSSGTSSEPGVSKNVEEITRAAMEKLGDKFSGPIWAEMKFNWSHAHSTPKLVKVHGGKLGDTYFKPTPTNYKVTWMARNEDFFALRWGVPGFIREHVRSNAAADYVGGYFVGSETYIPALDYFTMPGRVVPWRYAFERQWLFYKLWGRLLYDPQTPEAVFEQEFTRRHGPPGAPLLRAFALASSTQLRLASLYDSRWDFTLYGEGSLALQGDYTRYIGVEQLIKQPTMDPDYVSVADFVAATGKGETFASPRITPLALADLLERENREALQLVEGIDITRSDALMYEVADVRTWAHLGLHLAAKIRGAVALQTFRATSDAARRDEAVTHLQRALEEWDRVVAITKPIYRPMRLTHYNHNFFVPNPANYFHWAAIRAEVALDVDRARAAEAAKPLTTSQATSAR